MVEINHGVLVRIGFILSKGLEMNALNRIIGGRANGYAKKYMVVFIF